MHQTFQWLLRLLLLPFSLLYGAAVIIRNRLFDWDIIKSTTYDVPIVSIGNLTVGGTGKTPCTEYVVDLFRNKNRTAVLSRGYGRATKGFRWVTNNSLPSEAGDEPLQIKHKFGDDIAVAVCEKRVNGVNQLLKNTPRPTFIVLDDAFQHRYIKPGFSVVLVNYHQPIFKDWLLPSGRLREPVSGLNRCDAIVVTKCPENMLTTEKTHIEKRLHRIADKPVFFSTIHYEPLRGVFHNQTINMQQVSTILVVTGIANPTPMYNHLKDFAFQSIAFPDHHAFTQKDTEKIIREFHKLKGQNNIVITTEKDAQRLKQFGAALEPIKQHLFYLPLRMKFLFDGQQAFNQSLMQFVDGFN